LKYRKMDDPVNPVMPAKAALARLNVPHARVTELSFTYRVASAKEAPGV
jgi:hypothetical protein